MRKDVVMPLMMALIISAAPGTVFAQVPVQNVEDQAEPEAAQPQPQPEVPKKTAAIEVKDGRLSVDLSNADFGSVMTEIGAKMNFQVAITGDIYNKKLTTKFAGLDIERGIERLCSLAGTSNYLVRYDDRGDVSKVELYAASPPSVVGRTTMPTPAYGGRQMPLPFRRRYRRPLPQPQQPQVQPQIPQPPQPVEQPEE